MDDNLENIQDQEIKEQSTPKPKKERSEAQKANTERMRVALLAKHEASRKAKAEMESAKQKLIEERLLKKAEAIKKRTAKQMKVIESIPDPEPSDDDSVLEQPVEQPKPKAKAKQVKKKPPTPPPSSEEEDELSCNEEEEYIPPPPQPRRQVTQHMPQQRYIPQRPIIRYV